jgi:hypothetical protein
MPEAAQALDSDQLLQQVISLKAQIKAAETELAPLLDQLSGFTEEGDLDATFSFSDWSFNWSPGRASYSYPSKVKEIEATLKEAKKAAENDGSATKKLGAPFWTIRAPKP